MPIDYTHQPVIDRVPTEYEWRKIRRELELLEEYHPERGAEFLPVTYRWQEPTFGDRVEKIYKTVKLAVRLAPYFVQIIIGSKMIKNWKTTVTGIVGAVALVANSIFGVVVPQEAIIATVMFVIGLFAADGKKSEPAGE